MTKSCFTLQVRFLWLDGLRGIAAGYVLAFHFFEDSNEFASFGWFAVDLFFVLSGFVLSSAITRAGINGLSGLKTFAKKRILRIYPILIIALLSSLSIKIIEFSVELYRETIGDKPAFYPGDLINYTLSFLLLQFLFPIAITVLVPLWSLSTEMYSNLFQIILRLTGSVCKISLCLLVGVFFVIHSGVYLDLKLNWADHHTWFFGFGRAIIGFNLGQLIWIFSRKFTKFSWLPSLLLSTLGFVISIIIWLVAKDFTLAPVYFCFGFLILGFSKFRNPKVDANMYVALKVLGESSYPIYLFHTIFLGVVSSFITSFSIFSFVFFYFLNLIFAMIIVKHVEPRIRISINKVLKVY